MKINLPLIALACISFSSAANQTDDNSVYDAKSLVTVEEAEAELMRIRTSSLTHSEKVEQLKQLKELIDATKPILDYIGAERIYNDSASDVGGGNSNGGQVTEVTFPTQATVDTVDKNVAQVQRMQQVRELSKNHDSGFYMSQFMSIANDATGDLHVNGRFYDSVDLDAAIRDKAMFGNYRITHRDGRQLLVINTKTLKVTEVRPQLKADIENAIKFENELVQEYAKAILMGELEVDFAEQKGSVTAPKPLSVNYATMPTPYDSANN